MIIKKDYWIGAVAGILTGALTLAILYFLKISFPYQNLAALVLLPVLWAAGVWFGDFLGARVKPFFSQFGRYAAAGFLSTAIDFAVLNLTSYLTGVTAGIIVGWVNAPGFLIAVINGYLWNKLWVFSSETSETKFRSLTDRNLVSDKISLFHDFPKFFAVGVGGLIINSVLIVVLTTYAPASIIETVGSSKWLNYAKFIANIAVLIWNFTGFKFIVFKK
ncbi:MAG: GtrA family protein [Candidatus Giovannonibacteria bacterium]|nr:MAG: GtrA family protein [Candidatus Giovannonibacteria bacterium]